MYLICIISLKAGVHSKPPEHSGGNMEKNFFIQVYCQFDLFMLESVKLNCNLPDRRNVLAIAPLMFSLFSPHVRRLSW